MIPALIRLLRRLAPLVCVLIALSPRGALAQAGQVVLVLAERTSSADALESELLGALRGQLRELDVGVLVLRAAREPLAMAAHRAKQIAARQRALGVIWLETAADERRSVFLYDAGGHLYGRDVESTGSAASQSEALAIILRSAIAAMLEGEAVGMNEIELPPQPPPPPPEAPPSTAAPRSHVVEDERYLRGGIAYVGTFFVRHAPAQHGVAFIATARPTASPWIVGVDYTYFSSVELEADGVQITLERHPVEAFGGVELPWKSLRLNVIGAVSGDYLQRTTATAADDWQPTRDSGRWVWAVSTRLGLSLPIAGRLSAVLNLGTDFVLNPVSQALAPTSTTTKIVGSPLRARPHVQLGVMVSAW